MKIFDYHRIADEKLTGKGNLSALVYLIYSLIIGALSSMAGVGLLLLGGPVHLGLANYIYDVYHGENVDVVTLFKPFNKDILKSIILGAVSAIYIALWSLLFVIPGIIKMYSYSMIYFIQLENLDMHYEEVITKSRKIMKGNKGRLFCIHLSYIGWFILSALTFGILLFWVMPKVQMAKYELYRQISFDPLLIKEE
ncbi:MAG: DUF975 family protein [Erysipelotrichia bacterium]|jgi:uncharacterized membrane protein|nr:DUF975 family protein [Erysipelotrichia bacterium]